jgi:glutamate-1-semialdehyde 2,1-aminomutase
MLTIVEEAVKTALSTSPSFGAPTAREAEMAELICSIVPSVEKVRMVNSGTEATMSAIRVARGLRAEIRLLKWRAVITGTVIRFLSRQAVGR